MNTLTDILDRDGHKLQAALAESDAEVSEDNVKTDAEVERHAEAIDSAKGRTIEAMLKIGEHLEAVHKLLAGTGREGGFARWLSERVGFSRQSAYNYIYAFQKLGKCQTVLHFDPTAIHVLSAPTCPEKATAEAIRLADRGERVTAKVARKLRAKHTPAGDDDPGAGDLHDDVPPGAGEPRESALERRSEGIAFELAHEAVTCLGQIPQDDPLRAKALKTVRDWLDKNE